MKCKECGLDYEVTTTTSETGDISLRGIHVAGGVDCLTRQLAAKSAECERLREACAAAAWVLGAARLAAMGGTPDLFCPDIEGYGLISEAGEDYWDTWDRYATESIEHIEALAAISRAEWKVL